MDSSTAREFCDAILACADAGSQPLYTVKFLPSRWLFFIFTFTFRRYCTLTSAHCVGLTLASLAFLLPWQFSQFVLVTQVVSLFVLHALRLLPSSNVAAIFLSLSAAFFCNIILQFGNQLLLTSLLPSALLSSMVCYYLAKVTGLQCCYFSYFSS